MKDIFDLVKDSDLTIETKIELSKFKPRPYQLPIITALENEGYKRVIAILPRRSGKDITAFNIVLRAMLRRIGVYFYIFPTYSHARKVIWDSITIEGEKFLDFIPAELIAAKNSQEMKITLTNGSILQLVGSDNWDSLVGTNPLGIVFSEYALQDPRAYQYLRPILTANLGWALFLSTPRGKNHLYELFQIAKNNPDNWFAYRMTVEETGHIPLSEIEQERREGIMSEDMIQQEYYVSFDMGIEGSYYAKYLDRMRVNGQISDVPWESSFKVHTAWDLGVRDSTTIIFFQVVGTTVRIIDCYENSKVGLDHYAKILQQKPYSYGKHIAPHDIKVREFGTGMSRFEKARQLGISFTVAPGLEVEDGIEATRSLLSKTWIDKNKAAPLIKALENYRQEWDSRRKVYQGHPLHDWSSHFCFTGDTKILTRNGMHQMKEIEENDEILTLYGWKKCTKARKTQENAQLVLIQFSDGTIVRCTPDHLFLTTDHLYLTTDNWVPAKNLHKNTQIQSSLTNSLNILKQECILYGLLRANFLETEIDRIELSGKKLLEQYLKIALYIINTMIPITTISGVSNVYQSQSVLQFLGLLTNDLQLLLEKKRQNGIDKILEDYGIGKILEDHGIKDKIKDLNIGQYGNALAEGVDHAQHHLMILYDEMDMGEYFVLEVVKPLTIVKVELQSHKEDVWDIGVPDIGHYSLSNGAIVHNCDSMRYLAVSLPKTKDGLSPEDLDRRYNEAMGGSQANLPPVFRNDLPNY